MRKTPPSAVSIRNGFLQPRSRGWCGCASTDPTDPPRILMNMFADPADLDAMVRVLRLSRLVYSQSPLREMIRSETLPGPGILSDADLKEHIRRNAGHRLPDPVGTCRIGHGADAVVDPQLRVHGLQGLRTPTRRSCRTCPVATRTCLPSWSASARLTSSWVARCLRNLTSRQWPAPPATARGSGLA